MFLAHLEFATVIGIIISSTTPSGSVNKPLCPYGAPIVMKMSAGQRYCRARREADEVAPTLEQLSPLTSLIWNARKNQ
jgi:hypothetical protein